MIVRSVLASGTQTTWREHVDSTVALTWPPGVSRLLHHLLGNRPLQAQPAALGILLTVGQHRYFVAGRS
jgi:hypothetical protein